MLLHWPPEWEAPPLYAVDAPLHLSFRRDELLALKTRRLLAPAHTRPGHQDSVSTTGDPPEHGNKNPLLAQQGLHFFSALCYCVSEHFTV